MITEEGRKYIHTKTRITESHLMNLGYIKKRKCEKTSNTKELQWNILIIFVLIMIRNIDEAVANVKTIM